MGRLGGTSFIRVLSSSLVYGGSQCYMAPHNEEDDPAVYRASTHKKPTNRDGNGASGSGSNSTQHANGEMAVDASEEDDEEDGAEPMDAEGDESPEEEEEDSTLLTVLPGFNRLLLVLRDERVMRFVKYVSAAAEGSRWDICGEYEVGMVQQDGENSDSEGVDVQPRKGASSSKAK